MTIKPIFYSSAAAFALLLAGCGDADAPEGTTAGEAATETVINEGYGAVAEVETANYSLERTHAFLYFEVGHAGGISDYRVDFLDYDADLSFNAEDPTQSELTVTINPALVKTNYPGDYKAGHADSPFETWDEDISRSERWLNADAFPSITFTSTDIVRTGENTGEVKGDLSFLGTTQNITLDVSYGGVANPPWFGDRDVIGFNATTTIDRSDFGMEAAIPNITDAVTISFSGEFLQDET